MMSSFLHKMLLLCSMALLCSVSNAQLPDYQLNRIQEEDGLKTSDVINLAKDRKGFLWIASQSHIHCFDGRHTVSFPFTETINKVVIDMRDRKWVLTRGGIFLFDDTTRGFRQIPLQGNQRSISNSLYETADGAVCISGNGDQYAFSDEQQQFIPQKLLPSRLEMIPADKKGHKTVLTYHALVFDKEINDDFFSPQNMPRVK